MNRSLSALALTALTALTSACAAPCETGEACDRRCPTGGIGVCAAYGLCACVAAPDGGLADPAALDPGDPGDPGGPDDPDDPGGATDPPTDDGSAPAACAPPTPEALVINELMLDGEPTEDAEFVELVNPTAQPVALAGVVLTSNRGADHVRRVVFTGGCLPAQGALAMYPARADWVEAPASPWPIEAEVRSFGFSNGGDFEFRLATADGAVLDALAGLGDLIAPGVSLNRDPDRLGDGLAPHPTLDAGGLDASPGRCPNGGAYHDGCRLVVPDAEFDVDGPLDGPSEAADDPNGAGDAPTDDPLDDPADEPIDEAPDTPDEPPPDDPTETPRVAEAPPPDCPDPEPGDLVISEVMVDGAIPRTERDEFVEVVNRTPLPRRLRGVGLGYAGDGPFAARVRFGDGCLPAHGAVVIRPRLDDWSWHPAPEAPPTVERADLALGNEATDPLLLVGPNDRPIARFPLVDGPIVEGVSLTRYPGLDGLPTLHDRLGPRPSSPGSCPDGRPFGPDDCAVPALADDCAPPRPGELTLDEVLVDGAEPGERDEFVELVNPTDHALSLDGVEVWTNRGDGTLALRLRVERGCLPAGERVAIFADLDRWIWSTPTPPVLVELERFGFPNDAPFALELRRGEVSLGLTQVDGRAAGEGVSLARRGATPGAAFERHDVLTIERSSPGRETGAPPLGAP